MKMSTLYSSIIHLLYSGQSQSKNVSVGKRYTLPSHNQTGYAVWDAGACCQESDAHDDIRDSKSVANYSHLREM